MNTFVKSLLGLLIMILYALAILAVAYALWIFLQPETFWQKLVMIVVEIMIAAISILVFAYPTTWALEKLDLL